MLGLFKEEIQMSREFALTRARDLLVSYLNKGLVPQWENFLRELPTLENAEDLEEVKANFLMLTEWIFLEEYLKIDGTEFFFHSPNSCQAVLRNGKKSSFKISLSSADWQLWLEILSIKFNQNWNVQQPFASFYAELFGKKYRITLIHWSTSPEKVSKVVLRSIAILPHGLDCFGETECLKSLVSEKKNILVAGSTGSGKTSLLSSLLTVIPPDEHLVILEDTYEILSLHPHQTRFLSGSNDENSLKSYLSYSLRISPDRIILGEMRSHEVIPFLMAMNTGHKGLMGTIHASTGVDAIHRLALLFSLYSGEANLRFERIVELICRNLEYVVFMENKRIKEVIKILGSENGVPFFEFITKKEINFFT
jgi:type IV secretion system protein VirB11